jgi:hypothetical protein
MQTLLVAALLQFAHAAPVSLNRNGSKTPQRVVQQAATVQCITCAQALRLLDHRDAKH